MASDAHSAAYTIAAQVAAINAVRGLLAVEVDEDPRCGSVVMECATGGAVTVTVCDADGNPISGYTL